MRIRYNAPVTLTFALLSSLVLAADQLLGAGLIPALFTMPPRQNWSFMRVTDLARLFTHVAGHAGWTHLIGNFALVLLLGPILEEKYGSMSILAMIMITAAVTGLLNAFFSSYALLGASGVAFMMILLISFANIRAGEVPLTFILVVALYVTREFLGAFTPDGVAQFAHIAGGICGSMFGFFKTEKRGNYHDRQT